MTITSTNRKNSYPTNGVTTEFPFTFKITEVSQLKVTLVDSNDVEIEYFNFTVSINESTEGGTVTTLDVLDGYTLVAYRNTSLTQELDYVEGGRFPAKSHENAIDKLTQIVQEQQEEIDRTIKNPIGEQNPVDLNGVYGYIDTGDADTLQSANTYTDDEVASLGVSFNNTFIKKSGDTMINPLSGPRTTASTNYMPQYQLVEVVDDRIESIPGFDPQQFLDYGLITSAVTDVYDYGSVV